MRGGSRKSSPSSTRASPKSKTVSALFFFAHVPHLFLNVSLSRLSRSLFHSVASYNLRIRGAEYKDSPAMLQALARKMAESGGGGGGGGADRRGGDEIEASA